MHAGWTSLLLLCLSCVCTAFDPSFSSYAAIIDEIRFPKYSREEKQALVEQIGALMNVYVNRESKIEQYGVDPLPALASLKRYVAVATP